MHSLPLFRSTMAAAATAKTVLKTIKPHVPMIKFPTRTPAPSQSKSFEVSVSKAENKKPTPVGSTSSTSSNGQAIDSSQLPLKYRRKPLTSEEIEIIEKGGRLQ